MVLGLLGITHVNNFLLVQAVFGMCQHFSSLSLTF